MHIPSLGHEISVEINLKSKPTSYKYLNNINQVEVII